MSKDSYQLPLWVSHATPNISKDAAHIERHVNHRADGSEQVNGIFGADHGVLSYMYALKLNSRSELDDKAAPLGYMLANFSTKSIPAVAIIADKENYLAELDQANPQVIHTPEKFFEAKHGERVAHQDIPLDQTTSEPVNIETPLQLGGQIFFLKNLSRGEFHQKRDEHSKQHDFSKMTAEEIETSLTSFLAEMENAGYLEHHNQTLNINPLNLETGKIEWNTQYKNSHTQTLDNMATALRQAKDKGWQPTPETSAITKSDAPTAKDKAEMAERHPNLFNQTDSPEFQR